MFLSSLLQSTSIMRGNHISCWAVGSQLWSTSPVGLLSDYISLLALELRSRVHMTWPRMNYIKEPISLGLVSFWLRGNVCYSFSSIDGIQSENFLKNWCCACVKMIKSFHSKKPLNETWVPRITWSECSPYELAPSWPRLFFFVWCTFFMLPPPFDLFQID